MMRRLLVALVLLFIVGCGTQEPSAAAAGQPPPAQGQPAQQNEYVPIDQLPPQEALPAAPLLIAAYIVVWLGLMGYLFWIWRRIAKVEVEMQALQRRTTGSAR